MRGDSPHGCSSNQPCPCYNTCDQGTRIMATLRVRVLGGLQAAYDGQPPLVFPQEALAVLVAYLVLHPGTHHLTYLAEVLYPSLPTAESARHITGAINRLRSWLTPRGYSTSPFIVQQ